MDRFFFCFVTMLAFDGQRRTPFLRLDRLHSAQ